jgi:hypothetical protein
MARVVRCSHATQVDREPHSRTMASVQHSKPRTHRLNGRALSSIAGSNYRQSAEPEFDDVHLPMSPLNSPPLPRLTISAASCIALGKNLACRTPAHPSMRNPSRPPGE